MERKYGRGLSPVFRPWFEAADRWTSGATHQDQENRVRARAIFILGLLFTPLAAMFPISMVLAENTQQIAITLSTLTVTGMAFSLLMLRYAKTPCISGFVFCSATTFGLIVWPSLAYGIFAPSHVILALTPLLWGLMVNARVCLAYTSLLLTYFAILASTTGTVNFPITNAVAIGDPVIQGLLLLVATFVTGIGTAGYALMTNYVLGELQVTSEQSVEFAERASTAQQSSDIARTRFQMFADVASDWLWETDSHGRVTYFGGRGAHQISKTQRDIVGRHFLSFLDFRKHDMAALKLALSRAEPYENIPVRFLTDGGDTLIFELSASPRRDESGKVVGYIGVGKDVTDRVRAENDVRFLAENDKLTGLSNRHTFNLRINEELKPDPQHGSVLFAIDLDDFKSVNDSYGHHVGDALLIEVAARINSCIRKGDWAARLGGDEFVVMAVNYDPDKWAIDLMADRLLQKLAKPYKIEELELHMSASIGVARYPTDAEDARQLTQHADMALYAAKQGGRNQWRAFVPAMKQTAHQRKLMETGLRRALDTGSLEVWYQPLVSLGTNSIAGFEALARWTDSERGHVPPQIFIAVAEQCGLIGELGKYVMEQACREATKWAANEEGVAPRVSVNISAVQFSDGNLPEVVANTLIATGLAPERLELEITESILMADIDNAIRTLEALGGLGVGIAIDDFGTGYSSLSYLKRFPLSRLKVDRSFVHDLEADEHDRTITNTVVKLGESLGLSVIAEGVETEGQRALLQDMGCEEVQGYLYARPMPGSDIEGYLSSTTNHKIALPDGPEKKQSA